MAEWCGENGDEATSSTQAEGGAAAETSGPLLTFVLWDCGIEAGIIRSRAPRIENASANQVAAQQCNVYRSREVPSLMEPFNEENIPHSSHSNLAFTSFRLVY